MNLSFNNAPYVSYFETSRATNRNNSQRESKMNMNKEQVASKLNNTAYPLRVSKELKSLLIENNLVVVYGASDDLMEFDGCIYDEVGMYDGGHAFVLADDIIQPDDVESLDDGDVETVLHHFPKAKVIEAEWCKEDGYAWSYKTDIPHATFDIIDGDEKYCRGIVFSLCDLDGPESKLKSLKEDAFNSLDEAVSKLHKYACECEIGDERTKAFAIYQAARLAPRAEG